MDTLTSQLLEDFEKLSAFFTTRTGGTSQLPYSSANLAFHVGDNAEDVIRNHTLLADKIGYELQRLVHMRQIHSDRIIVIDETMDFDAPPECDAILTDRLDTPLMVMSADCTPILLYDPVHKAIGAVHAGRAGALNEILPKTIAAMQNHYQTSLEDIQIVFGPSIHGCCYEVNEMIYEETLSKGYPEALRKEENKVYLDVNRILLSQLERLAIPSAQIEVIERCTACHHHEFFSYRADAQHTGRIAGVIMMRS